MTKGGIYFMADTTVERKVQMPSATDLYNIDHLLSEEERMVRDTVRKFVGERVLPVIGEHFEAVDFPPGIISILAVHCVLRMAIVCFASAPLGSVLFMVGRDAVRGGGAP